MRACTTAARASRSEAAHAVRSACENVQPRPQPAPTLALCPRISAAPPLRQSRRQGSLLQRVHGSDPLSRPVVSFGKPPLQDGIGPALSRVVVAVPTIHAAVFVPLVRMREEDFPSRLPEDVGSDDFDPPMLLVPGAAPAGHQTKRPPVVLEDVALLISQQSVEGRLPLGRGFPLIGIAQPFSSTKLRRKRCRRIRQPPCQERYSQTDCR